MSKPNLNQQLTNLQNQAQRLHSDAVHENNPRRKKTFIAQKAELVRQISILRGKRDIEIQAESIKKLNELFKNSDRVLVLTVNAHRVKPDENLNVNFQFTCGHIKVAHISRILCYLREPQNSHALLGTWQANLRTSTVITSKFNCEQCKRAKDKKFSMFRRHSPKDKIGTCSVEMQIV